MDLKIPEIKINQPTISLIVGLVSLGISEFYKLKTLYWLSLIYTAPVVIVSMLTILVYLIRYAKKQ